MSNGTYDGMWFGDFQSEYADTQLPKTSLLAETILQIDEFATDNGRYQYDYSGYIVETSGQTIYMIIDSGDGHCASGYMTSEDNIADFIGATLYNIELVNEALAVYDLSHIGTDGDYFQFINFNTDRGTLQFVLYNIHNGYYGADVYIRCEQFEYEGRI